MFFVFLTLFSLAVEKKKERPCLSTSLFVSVVRSRSLDDHRNSFAVKGEICEEENANFYNVLKFDDTVLYKYF